MNILDEANKIVNERSEEKERSYGSFSDGMKRAASIASGMTGKNITADDMFQCMVALKFSRQSFNHKTDNLLDAVAYIGAWNNYLDEEAKTSFPKSTKYAEANGTKEFSEYVPDDFKEKFEAEVFPKTDISLHNQTILSSVTSLSETMLQMADKINTLTKYVSYLAENIDKTINYSEHIGEHVNVLTKYAEYIAENLNKIKNAEHKVSSEIDHFRKETPPIEIKTDGE